MKQWVKEEETNERQLRAEVARCKPACSRASYFAETLPPWSHRGGRQQASPKTRFPTSPRHLLGKRQDRCRARRRLRFGTALARLFEPSASLLPC